MQDTSNTDDYLDKPLWGVKPIADEINRTERATYQLPAQKVGSMWTSTRRRLRAHFAGETS